MKEIIKFAEARGYKGHLKYLPLILPRVHLDPYFLLESHESDIFFDHDFLKAVFGDNWGEDGSYEIRALVMTKPEYRKDHILNIIRSQENETAG